MQTIAFSGFSALFIGMMFTVLLMLVAPLVQQYFPNLFVHNPNILSASLLTISPACNTALPGITKVWGALAGDVSAIPAIGASHTISTDITMVATKYFVPIKIDAERSMFEEPMTGSRKAKYYNPKLTMEIAGEDGASLAALADVGGCGYVFIVQFTDGTQKVVGSTTTPLEVDNNDFKTGTLGSTDLKGTSLIFSGFTAVKAAIYTGDVPLA
jgi:hypothetical protein